MIQGNLIGTDPTGILPLPNNLSILLNTLDTTDVLIGGPSQGEGNVIAFNQGVASTGGILFTGGIWNLGVRITIRGNSIHDNFGLGIDNSEAAISGSTPTTRVTRIPACQRVPELPDRVFRDDDGPAESIDTRIQGVLHSTPSTTFTLDFY